MHPEYTRFFIKRLDEAFEKSSAGTRIGGQNAGSKHPEAFHTKPGESPHTFNGQHISTITSHKGAPVTHKFFTAQGSEYIKAQCGGTRRIKGHHANTGGTDSGLHGWNDTGIFSHGEQGSLFNMGASNLMSRGHKIKISRGKMNPNLAFVQIQNKDGSWRHATHEDAHPDAHAAWDKMLNNPNIPQAEKVKYQEKLKNRKNILHAKVTDHPVVGAHMLEYKSHPEGHVTSVHAGSPVSHVEQPHKT